MNWVLTGQNIIIFPQVSKHITCHIYIYDVIKEMSLVTEDLGVDEFTHWPKSGIQSYRKNRQTDRYSDREGRNTAFFKIKSHYQRIRTATKPYCTK